jgi:pimeloyl-ACP methyl ester carboxylesterase
MLETRTVITTDGRTLCVEAALCEGPHAILAHLGTPNSRHLFADWVADAAARGASIAAYDRPGYGGSTPAPGRTIADGAADTRAVADALGFERFAVWGVSGGGPYALACAALLADRVRAAAVLSGAAPFDAPGLDYFAGMGQENVDDTRLFFSDPAAARRKAESDRLDVLGLGSGGAEQASETPASLVSDADRVILDGPAGEFITWCNREGLAPGADGWFDDFAAELSPWGFELGDIAVPVKIWHGAHDLFVPRAHGEWLATQIPGAQTEFSDRDGHLTVPAQRIDEVHAWLLEHP